MKPSRRASLTVLALSAGLAVSALFAGGAPSKKASAPADKSGDRLVIHEWGTFTCLQDESGRAIAGVNTDDEPVPQFVHRIVELIPRPTELAPVYSKGVPRSHRQVYMRLETPVLYFHPPAGQRAPLHATVKIGFRGGWLTEYFPTAQVHAPGLEKGEFRFSALTPKTKGTLEWHDLSIGGEYQLPETDARAWLAPREVAAATVKTPGGEAEKYLFYRGVGSTRSPLVVSRNSANDGLVVREELDADVGLHSPLTVRNMWIVHVREDGTVAYRSLGAAKLTGERGRILAKVPVDFAGDDKAAARVGALAGKADKKDNPLETPETLLEGYASENLAALRRDMKKDLVADGLYDDEAEAMLNTWELAYFKSAGLRLFYLLPHEWTDAVLPLSCSLGADVSRTMVGRVEIVTPGQRRQIQRISSGPISKINWLHLAENARQDNVQALVRLWEGKARLADLGIEPPPDYKAYVALGRFRNALILDELTRHPDVRLQKFAEEYYLNYYSPADDDDPAWRASTH